MVEGKAPAGRLRKIWQNIVSADTRLLKVDHRDQKKWRTLGRHNATGEPSSVWNTALTLENPRHVLTLGKN